MLGDDQGMLLYLLGSDGSTLQSGNDAFELVTDKYGDHPLAVYARMVKGLGSGPEVFRGDPGASLEGSFKGREISWMYSLTLRSRV